MALQYILYSDIGITTEIVGGQKSKRLLAGQESTSHWGNTDTAIHKRIIAIYVLHIPINSILARIRPYSYTIYDTGAEEAMLHWSGRISGH